jgi:hypothetical protein
MAAKNLEEKYSDPVPLNGVSRKRKSANGVVVDASKIVNDAHTTQAVPAQPCASVIISQASGKKTILSQEEKVKRGIQKKAARKIIADNRKAALVHTKLLIHVVLLFYFVDLMYRFIL